jgi:endonuclease/exonuclease/phosphatase (EEP) superfamily protein YafD
MPLLDRALLAATAVTGFAVVLAFAHPWWWLADLLVHFRVQYLLLLLPLLAVATLRQSRVIVVLASVVLVANLCGLQQVSVPAAVQLPKTDKLPLKLMSHNAYYRNRTPHAAMQQIGAVDADLVAIQEFANPLLKEARFLRERYTYFYPDEDKNWAQVGLLATWRRQSFAVRDVPGGRLAMLEMHFPARPDKGWPAFTLISTHTQSPRSARTVALRNQQMADLAAYVRGLKGPVIVTGDFNTSPYSRAYADFLLVSGLVTTRQPGTFLPTWSGKVPWLLRTPIDQMFVTPDIAVRSFRVGKPAGSDHAPLIAELVWK